MGAPFKRVSEGDPISADAWNEIVDRLTTFVDIRVARQRGEVPLSQQRTVVFVQNDSGSDVDRFGVLGISNVFPTPTDNLDGFKAGPVLHGITPAAGTHEGIFVVLLEPAESGKIARAYAPGIVVQISVGNADHPYADVKDADSTQLESGWSGSARILWKQSGTGTKWAVVRIGAQMAHQARWIKFVVNDGSGFSTTDSSVTVDGVEYFDGDEPSTAVTTVYNVAASSNYIFEGDDNDKGMALYDPVNDKYWIVQMECP
jgi:hypothetical protein